MEELVQARGLSELIPRNGVRFNFTFTFTYDTMGWGVGGAFNTIDFTFYLT